jgi:hypothetical protein
MEYLEIGPTPWEEECEQVGTPTYNKQRAHDECEAYAKQLKRLFPDGDFRVRTNRHDFGSYFEVAGYWDDSDDDDYGNNRAREAAYEAESNSPAKWDKLAEVELGIRPRDDGYMAEDHFNAILDKNEIARYLTKVMRGEVEKWIGVGNQPSIKEIMDYTGPHRI